MKHLNSILSFLILPMLLILVIGCSKGPSKNEVIAFAKQDHKVLTFISGKIVNSYTRQIDGETWYYYKVNVKWKFYPEDPETTDWERVYAFISRGSEWEIRKVE